jgi:hypothetical protein
MALPKIDVPIFEVKLISSGKTVRFRPFSVKEQKLFLMAAESQDVDTSINTIRQVLQNCVLDDINVDSLPVFDIENLFLNLRARSVGEIVNVRYRCNNEIDDDTGKHACGNIVEYDLNILDIEPSMETNHSKTIEITDKLGMVMKYPTFDMIKNAEGKEASQTLLDMIVDCIDYIYDDEQIFYSKDTSRQELVDFVDTMQSKDLNKLQEFFDTMPRIKKTVDFKCGKCGYHETIEVEGTDSFFV